MAELHNRSHRLLQSCKTRFTLIELLVVVAIIGILATILMPSLKKAREAGKRAVCLNNTKQIGFAMINYTDLNDEYFPLPTGPNSYSWDDYLGTGNYDGRNLPQAIASGGTITDEQYGSTLYYCPTANYNLNPVSVRDYVDSNGRYGLTYSMNHGRTVNINPTDSKSGLGAKYSNAALGGWSAKVTDVENHAETISIGEHVEPGKHLSNSGAKRGIGWRDATTDLTYKYHGRHGKFWFTNMSFVDGHAKYIDIRSTHSTNTDNMWDRN